MNMSDTLNELKDDVTNIITENISMENAAIGNIEINSIKKNGIAVARFPKETLNKINMMFNLMIIKDTVNKSEHVDRAIATEVFTMLPDIPKHEQAKLTSSPSIINKEILTNILETNIDNKYSVDVEEKLRELQALIVGNMDKFEIVNKFIAIFQSLIKDKLEALTIIPPMVIEIKHPIDTEENKNININLLLDNVYEISILDDTKLDYEKYANVLTNKYRELYNDEGLIELSTIEKDFTRSKLSLGGFIVGVDNITRSLSSIEFRLKNYVIELDRIFNDETILDSATIEFINGYEHVATDLEYLSKVYEVTKEDNNCFNKVVDLINFI